MTTDTEKSAELLPCPFCGGDARISEIQDESLWSHDVVVKTSVRCDECDSATPYTEPGHEVEAIELWNTRAQAAPTAEKADVSAERTELVAAWNDLPDSLRCHPGLKRLYRACGNVPDAALAKPVPQAVQVPSGYVLVPVEPTDAMAEAGIVGVGQPQHVASAIYRAMLAAAPTAPVAEPVLRRLLDWAKAQHGGDTQFTGDHPIVMAEVALGLREADAHQRHDRVMALSGEVAEQFEKTFGAGTWTDRAYSPHASTWAAAWRAAITTKEQK